MASSSDARTTSTGSIPRRRAAALLRVPPGWLSFSLCKGDSSHPAEKTCFSRLYPRSRSFGHDPSLMTIGEGRDEDWSVDRAQLPFRHNHAIKHMQHHTHCSNSPIDLTPHHHLTAQQNPEVLELLHLRQRLIPHPEKAIHRWMIEQRGWQAATATLALLQMQR